MNPIMIDMLVKAKQSGNYQAARLQTVFSSGRASSRRGIVQKLVVILATSGGIARLVGWIKWTL